MTREEFNALCVRISPGMETLITHRNVVHMNSPEIARMTIFQSFLHKTGTEEDLQVLREYMLVGDKTGTYPHLS